jgi:hypothetical protein
MAHPGALSIGIHGSGLMETAIRGWSGGDVVFGRVIFLAGNESVKVTRSSLGQRGWRRRSPRRARRLSIRVVSGARAASFTTTIVRVCRGGRVHVPRAAVNIRSSTPRLHRARSHKTDALATAKILLVVPLRGILAGSAQLRGSAPGGRLRSLREERRLRHGPGLGSRVGLLGSNVGIPLCQRGIEMLEADALR